MGFLESEIVEKVTDCLDYLLSTDEEYGALKGKVKALEHRLKVAKSEAYLEATGDQKKREADAYTSAVYRQKLEEYENATIDMETIAAKRKSRELVIEVWRSTNANRRAGNV